MTQPPSHPRSKITRRQLFALGAATTASALSAAFAVAWQRDQAGLEREAAVAPASPPSPPPAADAVPDQASPTAEDAAPAVERAAMTISVLCRASWRAAPAAGVGTPHTIQQITVHHSGVALTDNRQVPSRIRRFQQLHQGARGWSDIAYHYVIDAEGNTYEGRAVDTAGDTATDYDPTGHFLALCDGNFEEHDIPERQLDGLARLLAWAVQRYGLSVEQMSGHKDHAVTACPGEALYARLQSGDLANRVAGHLAAGPWELAVICGPEADAVVRAIEAGAS